MIIVQACFLLCLVRFEVFITSEQNPETNIAVVALIKMRFIKEGDGALEKWAV